MDPAIGRSISGAGGSAVRTVMAIPVARYFRILNEVPTVLMIGIVILVIVKPF